MPRFTPVTARAKVLVGTGAAAVTAAALLAPLHASAAGSTLYVSASGTGTACTADQPCSLDDAKTTVRSLTGGMSGDVVVQLADGVYRRSTALTFTAADSGTNGHSVIWQAAPGAHPTITGARQVSGWTQADASKNIWQANVGTGANTRQLYVNGVPATRARGTLNRSDFTATTTGLRFSNGALGYLNSLANQNRVEIEGIGSWTDRYSPVQSISNNFLTMQQPAWENNNFGWDPIMNPFRKAALYVENAYELLDAAGEWYLNSSTGVLSYIPQSGQNMSSADVELPQLQYLVGVAGTYDNPAHDLTFAGITFTGTSWLGPSSNQGYVDQQTGAFLTGTWAKPSDYLSSCQVGCPQIEATRAHWNQMPAAVQVSAANAITFNGDQFVNLGQMGIGIGNDANAHASGVGYGTNGITVTNSTFARLAAGGVLAGGTQADAHHPSDARMTNKNLTISNNSAHDLGLDYRGITSFLPTYVTNATISHNEIYNLPYSGVSFGFGWGANDAGGSEDYANRGLYNYQPRYSTATTASNNQITDNYIHDVMQSMNDGSCVYTLSANSNGRISGNYCTRTSYLGVYFDEGSRYITATNNVLDGATLVGHQNISGAKGSNNTGNLTFTNNWSTGSSIDLANGQRGDVVSGNVQVSNGNWPSGARTVMSNAGVKPVITTTTTTTTTSRATTTTTTISRATTTSTTPVTTTTTTSPVSTTTTTPVGTTTTTTTSPVGTTTTTRASGETGCTATYAVTGSWPGGFQGAVTVMNTGSAALSGWTVGWTFPNGQVISQLWGGTVSQSGATVSVRNEAWNGGLAPGQSTTFGFLASWNGTTNGVPSAVTCG